MFKELVWECVVVNCDNPAMGNPEMPCCQHDRQGVGLFNEVMASSGFYSGVLHCSSRAPCCPDGHWVKRSPRPHSHGCAVAFKWPGRSARCTKRTGQYTARSPKLSVARVASCPKSSARPLAGNPGALPGEQNARKKPSCPGIMGALVPCALTSCGQMRSGNPGALPGEQTAWQNQLPSPQIIGA